MAVWLQDYTPLSIVVRGDTKPIKDAIKAIGGAKFGFFGGTAGWMFPKKLEATVRAALNITTPSRVVAAGQPGAQGTKDYSGAQQAVRVAGVPEEGDGKDDDNVPAARISRRGPAVVAPQQPQGFTVADFNQLAAQVGSLTSRVNVLETKLAEALATLATFQVVEEEVVEEVKV